MWQRWCCPVEAADNQRSAAVVRLLCGLCGLDVLQFSLSFVSHPTLRQHHTTTFVNPAGHPASIGCRTRAVDCKAKPFLLLRPRNKEKQPLKLFYIKTCWFELAVSCIGIKYFSHKSNHNSILPSWVYSTASVPWSIQTKSARQDKLRISIKVVWLNHERVEKFWRVAFI